MLIGAMIAGAELGQIIGGLIVSAASLTGSAATTTMTVSTATGIVGGAVTAIKGSRVA